MKEFIVPQDLNFDTYTKVFTEKQIAIIAGTTFVIGIIPSMIIHNPIAGVIFIALGVSVGYALAKVEFDGVILWDYLKLYYAYTKERKVFIMGSFLPISDIKDGVIYLGDGTVSTVYEITGSAIDMMSEASRAVVMQSLVELLYAVDNKVSFYAWRKKYDISRDLEEIKRLTNKDNKEYFESYKKMLLNAVSDEQIGTVRYFVIFNGTEEEVAVQGSTLVELASKNNVFKVRRIYGVVPMLYAVMNLHRAYVQKVGEEEPIL